MMMTMTDQLMTLANALAAHEGVTHWAVSTRMTGKGDFFDRLNAGGDCKTRTFEKVLSKFQKGWPADLEWPAEVPRPAPAKKAKAA